MSKIKQATSERGGQGVRRSLSGRSLLEASRSTILINKDMLVLSKKYDEISKLTGTAEVLDYRRIAHPQAGTNGFDWLIWNALTFLERLNLLYAPCTLFCTPDSCPMFSAGPHYLYRWEDENTEQPLSLSAPDYFTTLRGWIQHKLGDFPIWGELSDAQLTILQTAYRRMFRVLAHWYVCHGKDIARLGLEHVMNTLLIHYKTVALSHCMIQPGDIEMLLTHIVKIERWIVEARRKQAEAASAAAAGASAHHAPDSPGAA